MTLVEMRLMPEEAEVINHRIEVTDAMAQVFGPSGDGVWGFDTDEEAEERLKELLDGMIHTLSNGAMHITFDIHNEDQIRVLEELVDGNTMDSIAEDMVNQGTDEKVHKQGLDLKYHMKRINVKWRNAGLSSSFAV